MKKFIKKLLKLFPIFLLLIIVNFFVDPLHQLNYSYEKDMANKLSAGINVETYNFDERLFQEFYINNQNEAKSTVILGSSRAMLIGETILKQENIFNSCVSSASLEDCIAIYQIYKRNNILPKNIIWGIDPWIFRESKASGRWKSIGKYYYELVEGIDSVSVNKSFNYEKIKLIFSLSYFQDSICKLFETNEQKAEGNIKVPDGTIVYNSNYSNANEHEINKRAIDYVNRGKTNDLADSYIIDSKSAQIFEEFINIIKQDGVQITIFLSPYHPIVYDYISSEKYDHNVVMVENYIKSFAIYSNIEVIGSYNPITKNYKIDEEGFYDGFHPKESSVELIFEKY